MRLDRVAGAPISWGVAEVPGWGHILRPEVVLGEMQQLGLHATEFGTPGYLPVVPEQLRDTLDRYDLSLVGGFLATVLHDPAVATDSLRQVGDISHLISAAGGDVLVLAAASGLDGYNERPQLSDSAWRTLLDTLGRARDIAGTVGVSLALHPHVGTHVETAAEVDRFITDSDVSICLDTGHLLIGGTDPLAFARANGHRVTHVHLKDVDATTAARVTTGEITYDEGIGLGLYQPLGEGDVPVADVIAALEAAAYTGWWVLEQDIALPFPGPAGLDPEIAGIPTRNTAASLQHLANLVTAL